MAEAQVNAATQSYNISVDGVKVGNAFAWTMSYETGSITYYRLRDIAYAVKGTGAAFDIGWDNGVTITVGGSYDDEPIVMGNMPPQSPRPPLLYR